MSWNNYKRFTTLVIVFAFIVTQRGKSVDTVSPIFHTRCSEKANCSTSSSDNDIKALFPPQSAEAIGTTFRLHTRQNPEDDQGEFLLANDTNGIAESSYNKRWNTIFITHGFWSFGRTEWVTTLKNELLTNKNLNVIVVDWSKGAQFPYSQATPNTRVVATQIVQLLKVLQQPPEKLHLIGHSLGAHISGFVGEQFPNIARITGLDPASIYFYENKPETRLDRTDADFVDIIHTNGGHLGVGLSDQLGHADFYVNGGKYQPGCNDNTQDLAAINTMSNPEEELMSKTFELAACSHHRAIVYYTESINQKNCVYWAFNCTYLEAFENKTCGDCSNNTKTCNRMGFHASKYPESDRIYQIDTLDTSPHCGNVYKLNLRTGSDQSKQARGDVTINVTTGVDKTSNSSTNLTFSFDNTVVIQNVTKQVALFRTAATAVMTGAEITYKRNAPLLTSWLYGKVLDVRNITVETIGTQGKRFRTIFCGNEVLDSDKRPTALLTPYGCIFTSLYLFVHHAIFNCGLKYLIGSLSVLNGFID